MKTLFMSVLAATILIGCSEPDKKNTALQQEVDAYLASYNKTYQELLAISSEAEWVSNTKIIPGDTIAKKATEAANLEMAKFTGSKENIKTAGEFLKSKDELPIIQVRQLKTILYMAAGKPATAEAIVKKLIKANAEQTEKLYGYDFTLNGKSISTNDIDEILRTSDKVEERLKVWESSKEVGKTLASGLSNLQNLRNKSVQALEYDNYFQYQVSSFDLSVEELRALCKDMIQDIWPLYRELHTWARYTLAERYGEEVPEMLPAHWLPNRWGQEWTALVNEESLNLDAVLAEKSAEWIMKEGEAFYVSMGFEALPASFYEKSSLYPLPENAEYKKNNHASAWHMDNDKDVRSLMSVIPNTQWWGTSLHELGHIYYYITYTNPDVPIVLRGGANRAFHEAIGSLLGLAAMQKPFLAGLGLLPENVETDEMQALLKEALEFIIFIPWSAGVMTEFEYELYANNLPVKEYNKKWWELKKKYQGIVPPYERGEAYCDPASKTHISDDAAQYYDYAISNVLLFQFHDYIAKNILKQPSHATNYYGSKETGDFLKEIMYPGANVDWREHLEKSIGSPMSAKPMVDYFAPLMDYLKKQNEGRKYTLQEKL